MIRYHYSLSDIDAIIQERMDNKAVYSYIGINANKEALAKDLTLSTTALAGYDVELVNAKVGWDFKDNTFDKLKDNDLIFQFKKYTALFLKVCYNEWGFGCEVYFPMAAKAKAEEICNQIYKSYNQKITEKPQIGLLVASQNGLAIKWQDTPKFKTNITLNYGEDFVEKYKKLKGILSTDQATLTLLHSVPGTGKTSLVKHLISELKTKKILYLAPAYVNELASPAFLPLMLNEKPDILVIEEAENCLVSREDRPQNSAVSNLLNITDGILGDLLNIRVLATFNTDKNHLDKALVRKGRLSFIHEFKPLKAADADNLLKSLKKPLQNKAMTLAEIYNLDQDNGMVAKIEPVIGFK